MLTEIDESIAAKMCDLPKPVRNSSGPVLMLLGIEARQKDDFVNAVTVGHGQNDAVVKALRLFLDDWPRRE